MKDEYNTPHRNDIDENDERDRIWAEFSANFSEMDKQIDIIIYFVYLKDDEGINEFPIESFQALQNAIQAVQDLIDQNEYTDKELFRYHNLLDDGYRVLNTSSVVIRNEKAVEREDFFLLGLKQSASILERLGKICVFENDDKMNHLVECWKKEIASLVYDIIKVDVKNDDQSSSIKKNAFIASFIEGRLGEGGSEYDDKMYSYIEDGLEKEGMSTEQIREIDSKGIAAENKERIKHYLFSFVELLPIKDRVELKERCEFVASQF